MSTAFHCPGQENPRDLSPYLCTCPHCGKEQEFFSDELEKEIRCRGCKKKLDPKTCVRD
jgi:ribosomal protein S27E